MSSFDQFMVSSPSEYTLDEEYKVFIESLVPLLKKSESTRTIAINPEKAYLHTGDFTSFLSENGVPLEDHYLILLMNDMASVSEFNEEYNVLKVPDVQEL